MCARHRARTKIEALSRPPMICLPYARFDDGSHDEQYFFSGKIDEVGSAIYFRLVICRALSPECGSGSDYLIPSKFALYSLVSKSFGIARVGDRFLSDFVRNPVGIFCRGDGV